MAGRPNRRVPKGEPAPRCVGVQGNPCKTIADRSSDLCSWHSHKEAERWADEYEARADAGMTFPAALDLPVIDRPLGQLSTEERRGLALWMERRFPHLGSETGDW